MGPLTLSPLCAWLPPLSDRSARPKQLQRGARRLLGIPRRLFRVFVAGTIAVLACGSLWAQGSSRTQPGLGSQQAFVDVHLRLPDGSHFEGIARVRILSPQGLEVAEHAIAGVDEASLGEVQWGDYIVEASAPGFVTSQERVEVRTSGTCTVYLTLTPNDSDKSESPGITVSLLAPAARKEMAKGLEEFRKNDMKEARKHFEKVLAVAPANPDIHFLMGALELKENNAAAAQEQLTKAIQLFPNHAQSLELLGVMYCQRGEPQTGVPLLERAASLEDGSWKVHWKLASAYLQVKEPEKARQQAERAIELGKGAAGEAQVLRALAFAKLDQRDAAQAALETFVHDQPNDPAIPQARSLLVQLHDRREQEELEALPLPLREAADISAITAMPPASAASKNSAWAKPGVDDLVPPVAPGVSCSLPKVLNGAGKRVEELVSNLEKFSAKEQVQHFSVDRKGEMHSPEVRSYEYLAVVSHEPRNPIYLEEYRDGTLASTVFPAGIATKGLPAMALIFHPQMSSDFDFVCEGLGKTGGRPAWQVHFQQRADRESRIRAFVIAGHYYPLSLKGRAWIDAATFQVARLETELINPVPEIHFKQEHLSIQYEPVRFRSQNVQIWLPKTAELFVERNNAAFYRTHTFSQFQLFNVGVSQKFQAPKESYSFTNLSDREVSGQFTITPLPQHSLTPITITFTIPPMDSVSKVVGRGKDLNIPPDWIDSARFVYGGDPGIIEVNASLTKESTLEVDPEPQSPAAPQN